MKRKILCVDDESINLKALSRVLEELGEVITVSSGSEALEVLNQNSIAILLTDQRMPEMSGLQLLQKAKILSPFTKRVLISGQSDLETTISAINDGQICQYISKPFDLRSLQLSIRQVLEIYELEQELREKNERLEKAVTDLKNLDSTKNQFMVLVNHELKTPLTALMSFLELLKETALNDEQKLFTRRISENSDRLHGMINEILELVAAQMQLTPIHISENSSQNLINQSIVKFNNKAQLKELDFIVEGENLSFLGDSQAVMKILDHLVENAVKFADKNSAIHLKSELNESGKVQFIIKNQGATIRPQVLESIKKPFFLDEDILNHSEGLGIGLSLSEALLKRHDSSLHVSSDEGQVQVEFSLPAKSEGLVST